MDGNRAVVGNLRSVIALCCRALEEMALPESGAGLIEEVLRLEELQSALTTVTTRLEVAAVLCRGPAVALEAGTTPMATEAVDRLLLALINVLALQDT
ncbi:hypothetical protein [uncultured Arthrobacter sp.]|uniref:hypothetical protein n=1 Tax=uncultured Arthrobacter sp. TaxID=114050 RepID=UPI003217D26D